MDARTAMATATSMALAMTAACGDGEPGRRPIGPIANAPSAQASVEPAPTAPTTPAAPTVADRVAEHGPAARARLAPAFARAAVPYPPRALTLIAIKDERRLEVWADRGDGGDDWAWIVDYPVLAASGGPGPKLREGDLQVPEGVYAIDWLNPRSAFHLSLHVSYPSAEDRAMAVADGRDQLGGAIMIHGGAASIGCLAIGDPAIEELFTLVADTGLWRDDAKTDPRIRALLAPTDLRRRPAALPHDAPPWVAARYRGLAAAMAGFVPGTPAHPGAVVAEPPPTSAQ